VKKRSRRQGAGPEESGQTIMEKAPKRRSLRVGKRRRGETSQGG